MNTVELYLVGFDTVAPLVLLYAYIVRALLVCA